MGEKARSRARKPGRAVCNLKGGGARVTVKMRGWGKRECRRLDPRFGLRVSLGSESMFVGLPAGLGASVRVRACARPGEPAAPRPVAGCVLRPGV